MTIFKRTSVIAVSLLAASGLGLSACGGGGSGTDAAKPSDSGSAASSVSADPELVKALPAKIAESKKIIVGTDATYAPNEFLAEDGKTVTGMDVDIFNAVAAQFGVTAEYQPSAFDAIILGVDSGKYDVGVSSFTINDDRKQQVNMVSYFNAGTQWVTKTGNPKQIDPNNACGMNIGVQKGTVQVDDITAKSKACTDAGKPAINQIIEQDQSKVTTSLISGKVDAMLADSPIAAYAVKQTNGQLESLGDIYDSAPYGFVVPKKDTAFADAIAKALEKAKADGSYDKALEKWGNTAGAIDSFTVNP